ncbi:hypothetical protein OG339_39950 [Streptosporangium sp. NBC_01495]|uniref:hypothetical protein n=1 Tax=Streptosporangium sp. NBC_01495 TaxID=2903899 RepID=UPI002E33E03E|nr:hypothetical protein [Streptosporangium sp. NBC_01495]
MLETLPSWNSSGKVTKVASPAPIVALPELEELRPIGVVPPDRMVNGPLKSASLRRVTLRKHPGGRETASLIFGDA